MLGNFGLPEMPVPFHPTERPLDIVALEFGTWPEPTWHCVCCSTDFPFGPDDLALVPGFHPSAAGLGRGDWICHCKRAVPNGSFL
jgi:hypothetical protein